MCPGSSIEKSARRGSVDFIFCGIHTFKFIDHSYQDGKDLTSAFAAGGMEAVALNTPSDTPIIGSRPLLQRDELPQDRTCVDLPWTVNRGFSHRNFFPIGDPTWHPADCEQNGEKVRWNPY
jgi:hypothetical protein